ncbi:hypothetical protein TRFO_35869 [Tritrichomonas foetus]|uniref:CRC domain-containing protein n=1 Tax=Tritrichomonas foetus TaxID=1144522 RepID=A0A1J4JFE1_9EUKA|nr:hypothetical protein TRFO_35869 [Tritrichomonas foetus]|eukprot:OHS97858.1 hypothetical protein TRFO_35869 [Tritrichomonas foetus]
MSNPEHQANMISKSEEASLCNCTSGNCLSLECRCFRHGRLCKPNCPNPNCENNESHAEKRLAVMEELLSSNPMAFTGEDTLSQDECAAICNFAMLTTSVDAEKFRVEPKESHVSKLLAPDIVHQAIKTVMSSVNEDLDNSTPEAFEEKTENSIAQEFNSVLGTLIQHLQGHA